MRDDEILRKPLITEKTNDQVERHRAYRFLVARNATKVQIRKAVERMFEVKVTGVRTILRKGKRKRVGIHVGRGQDRKHAIVTLAEGQKIDLL